MRLPRPVVESLWSFWSRGHRVERAGYVVGFFLVISGLIHLAILVIGGGSWKGPVSLRKATTFGVSFGVTLITIAWVTSFLHLSDRARSTLLGTFTAACLLETGLVTLQAWRGVPSHFNMETTFDALVARTLAAGGIVLVTIIVLLTLAAFRANPNIPISLRIAIQTGFVTLVGAMAVGALMIARGMTLVFAGNPHAAYATAGALKPTHAATMHAILVLPALAWLVSFATWEERRRVGIVLVATGAYALVAGVVAVGNLSGVEFERLPPAAVVVLSLAAFLLLAVAIFVLRAVARGPVAKGVEHK